MTSAQAAVVITTAGLAGLSWLVAPAKALVRIIFGADSVTFGRGPTAALAVAAIVCNVLFWFALTYAALRLVARIRNWRS